MGCAGWKLNTTGQQRVRNIALINIEREYPTLVVNNDIARTIEMVETAISFNVFFELKLYIYM